MLAIISDLHLQMTDLDALRYRGPDGVRQIGVRRNVKAKALTHFFNRIQESAVRHASDEIHLVFAGDIFEIHRSPLWFLGSNNQVSAIDEQGKDVATNLLRNIVHEILGHLEAEHEEFWKTLRSYAQDHQIDGNPVQHPIPVEVHYIPGNHDRLANAWPSVRKKIRDLMSMPVHGRPFPLKLDFTGAKKNYRVRVRHGHEYDKVNFFKPIQKEADLKHLTLKDYLRPALGDYGSVDVGARLAMAFRARYARAMRGDTQRARRLRGLYLDLTEFDDVRPKSLLLEYLKERMGITGEEIFEDLRPILRDMIETTSRNAFFMSESKRLKVGDSLKVKAIRELLKVAPARMLKGAVSALAGSDGGDDAGPAEIVRWEPGLGDAFDLVIGGHTHRPDQVPLPNPDGRATTPFYLDSGTWRTSIRHGVECFGRVRAYTMIFCYNEREYNVEGRDQRRYETWTGHLTSSELGPYDEPARKVPDSKKANPQAQVRFDRIEVLEIEKELDGAELELEYGVDDVGYKHRWEGVRKGDVLRFSEKNATVPLDAIMDGEVWCFGVEKDVLVHDLLPWGLDRLHRAHEHIYEPGAPFKRGKGTVTLKGFGGAHLVLHYRVEEASS